MNRIISKREAQDYCGSRSNLNKFIAAGWVNPIPGKTHLHEIDRQELDRAIDRLILEGGWGAVTATMTS